MRGAHAIVGIPLSERGARRPPGRLDRVAARVRGPWLDRQLARGIEPWRSPALAARALQLTGDRRRRALARSLERLVDRAQEPAAGIQISAVVPPCREQVRAAIPMILEVSSRLRSRAPIDPRGVARLHALLCEGAGPCYVRTYRDALKDELDEVATWLEATD